jgi:hypothetical protein
VLKRERQRRLLSADSRDRRAATRRHRVPPRVRTPSSGSGMQAVSRTASEGAGSDDQVRRRSAPRLSARVQHGSSRCTGRPATPNRAAVAFVGSLVAMKATGVDAFSLLFPAPYRRQEGEGARHPVARSAYGGGGGRVQLLTARVRSRRCRTASDLLTLALSQKRVHALQQPTRR